MGLLFVERNCRLLLCCFSFDGGERTLAQYCRRVAAVRPDRRFFLGVTDAADAATVVGRVDERVLVDERCWRRRWVGEDF